MSKYKPKHRISNDAVHWYMSELTSRVIAESGDPLDRYHLGKIILQSLKDAPKDLVLQIDGATGETETASSFLTRSVRFAVSLRNFGVRPGDVIVLMAPNHLDLAVPFQAGLYLGAVLAPVDRTLGKKELQGVFELSRPRMIFCQSEKAPDIQVALNELGLDSQIVTFDKGDYLCSLADFQDRYGDDTAVADFKPTDLEDEDATGFLISTSGTTGLPKAAAVTYKNFAITMPYIWSRFTTFPTPIKIAMVGSPLQWITAIFQFLGAPLFQYTRLQTSENVTQEHVYHLINTYRPTFTIFSPTLMTTLLRPGDRERCDFTCLDLIILGGSAVPLELINDVKSITPDTEVLDHYGMSELSGLGFVGDYPAPGSAGKPMGCLQYRLVHEQLGDIHEPNVPGELWLKGPGIFKSITPDTEVLDHYGMSELSGLGFVGDYPAPGSAGKPMGCLQYRLVHEQLGDIHEPNVPGELWLKGPGIFKEYYNNPEATAEVFAEDRWFKTGDIFYRDVNWNFFFVERIKLLLKYKSHQISPVEVEGVIRQHPDVVDVAVTGIPDPECGDLVVACVVPRSGSNVTADEIKGLVKESLTDSKQLRGGVIFLSELPLTSTSKINRKKLKEIACQMKRE